LVGVTTSMGISFPSVILLSALFFLNIDSRLIHVDSVLYYLLKYRFVKIDIQLMILGGHSPDKVDILFTLLNLSIFCAFLDAS